MKLRTLPKNIWNAIWHHKVRTILVIVGLVIVGLIINQVTKPPQITRTKVTRQTLTEVVEASGRIKAKESANLAIPPTTRVVWVGIKNGDQVKKYQTVVAMDRRELQKSLQQKMLDYMTTRWDFEQVQDDHSINGRQLNQVGLSDEEKRILEKSQFGLDRSVLDYEIANLALEQAAVITPIEGTVVDTGNIMTGERLAAAETATRQIRVVNLKTVYYQAEVDESDYGKLKPGMKANINLDSFPDATISGTIRYIGKEGIKKTGGGVQIFVEVALDQAPVPIIPELTGDVSFTTKETPQTLVIDKKFVTQKDGKSTVLIMVNNKPIARDITTGTSNTKQIEILSGLKEGDEVVLITK